MKQNKKYILTLTFLITMFVFILNIEAKSAKCVYTYNNINFYINITDGSISTPTTDMKKIQGYNLTNIPKDVSFAESMNSINVSSFADSNGNYSAQTTCKTIYTNTQDLQNNNIIISYNSSNGTAISYNSAQTTIDNSGSVTTTGEKECIYYFYQTTHYVKFVYKDGNISKTIQNEPAAYAVVEKGVISASDFMKNGSVICPAIKTCSSTSERRYYYGKDLSSVTTCTLTTEQNQDGTIKTNNVVNNSDNSNGTAVDVDAGTLCKSLMPVFRIFGYIYIFIKILTPVFLLIFGMITMAKAIAAKDDAAMQKAWKKLTNSFIAAVSVFLVASLVGILMTMLSNEDYKACTACVNNPFGNCEAAQNNGSTESNCDSTHYGTCPSGQICSSVGGYWHCESKTCGIDDKSGTCPIGYDCKRQSGGKYECIKINYTCGEQEGTCPDPDNQKCVRQSGGTYKCVPK